MDKNKYDKELEFTQGLYDEAEEQIKEVYKEQKKNRDNLLQELALIMLTYSVLDGLMSLTSKDKKKEYNRLSNIILRAAKGQGTTQARVINDILVSTVNKTFGFYSYNANLKDVKKIIDNNFKGKHFSERVWENENEVAKHLNKKINDFLNGKINVNQIKKDIVKTFNGGAYNTKRLVETEVNRCSSNAFDRFCKETGVKKVKYNATLDSRLCSDCAQYHDRVFNLKDKIELPRHPLCRCFYTIEDDDKNQSIIINLQLLGIDEKKELGKLIDNGVIDKFEYNKCYNYFNKQFKNGVVTPIETVYNTRDRFIHIAQRHKNMISKDQIDNIINSLENPDKIYKSVDKFGIQAKGYVKKINNNELLTIVRNGIITSYYPNNNYISNKIKKGDFELIWERK